MKLKTLLAFVAVLFISTNLAASNCRFSYQISNAAHELSNASERFDDTIDYLTGYSHLSKDVHKLKNAASHLHRLADRGNSSCRHLKKDFKKVKKQYRHVKKGFKRAHDDHHNNYARQDWNDVKFSMRALRVFFTLSSF